MCGIVALALRDAAQPLDISSLAARLAHRGPDDHGWLSWEPGRCARGRGAARVAGRVVLGHRRLSIIDLSERGAQPMSYLDDRLHIAYNGEIYNYLELRRELERENFSFRSDSDTEVILAAWAAWGPAAPARLKGMFAFALLDTRARRLFLVRDFFGIKPLYYARWDSGFAAASEPGALLALPGVDRSIDAQMAYEYLQSGLTDHSSRTMYEQISQVPPAHYLELDTDSGAVVGVKRYWTLSAERRDDLSFDDAAQQLREMFLQNIALHLRSDVPIGAALSGGIDSSAIVCAIRHLQPDTELHTFSYVADDANLSEERWIDEIVRHTNAVSHKVAPKSSELVADVDGLIRAQGEPFMSTSIYAQNRVFALAREAGIKVMLDGQGADEILAGYASYQGARFATLISKGHWIDALGFLRASAGKPGRNASLIAQHAAQALLPRALHAHARRLVGKPPMPRGLRADWFKAHDVAPVVPERPASGGEHLRSMLCDSVCRRPLPQLLRYEDRNSMTHSIESRVPFLTPDLTEFVLSLPEEYLVSPSGESKHVFRAAMKGLVPASILARQDKIGFRTPEDAWLLSVPDWVEETLRAADECPVFDASVLRHEWLRAREGDRKYLGGFWRRLNFLKWWTAGSAVGQTEKKAA